MIRSEPVLGLVDIVQRSERPAAWSEGEKIPWNEPGFSRRMLREHLSQEHDWASRRTTILQSHVDWIHRVVMSGKPGRILDLGCGPGLYTNQLARLGHVCSGVDFSPASIEYAREQAEKEGLRSTYELQDIRKAEPGIGYDLAMFIYGEFNVFTPQDAKQILDIAQAAIRPGGSLLMEVHSFETVRQIGSEPSSWYSSKSGLFSDRPHVCLQENFWDEGQSAATQRYYILDAQTRLVTRYASSMQAYTNEKYRDMLKEGSFTDVEFFLSLSGEVIPSQSHLFVIRARRS